MKRERILLIFLLIILVNISLVSASVVINEVMYDFPGFDGNHEWIEIYNTGNEEINLSGWKFYEDNTKHSLNLIAGSLMLNSSSFAIIAEDSATFLADYPYFNGTLFDSSFSLSNSPGEEIALLNGTDIIGSMTYNVSIGANGSGNTLQLVNGSWCANLPTPGEANNCTIPNQPPTANFIFSPTSPTANQIVTFNATSSSDTDGSITLYSWNFSDGTNAIGNTTQHAFTTAGNYSIILIVTDDDNANSSMTKTVSVSNPQNQTQQNQTNTTQNCMLGITYAPEEAYFGSEIQVNISVYKNNTETDEYAVHLWIQSNEENLSDIIPFHAHNESTNYTFNASLLIDKKCNVSSNTTFAIIVQGLDEKINKSITLKENSTLCLPDFQYIITQVTTARINETFSTRVRIINNKNTDTEFDVWSYVYRGSKCYSCINEREENLNHILVEAKSSAEVLLYNTVKDAEPGNYSLKVKILKENLKTPKEYSFTIILEVGNETSTATETKETNLNAQNLNSTNQTEKGITGKAIYTSKTELNKRYAEIILISIFVLTALYFIFKPKIIAIREHGV